MEIKYILIFVLIVLSGCAAQLDYYELEEQAKITGDWSKVEKYEKMVEKAEAYQDSKVFCDNSSEHMWFCNSEELRANDAIEDYRKNHHTCGCATRADVQRFLQQYMYY